MLQYSQKDKALTTGKSYLPASIALGGEAGSSFFGYICSPAHIFFCLTDTIYPPGSVSSNSEPTVRQCYNSRTVDKRFLRVSHCQETG